MRALPKLRTPGIVPGLALADLHHEWILTLCLLLAIAAVVAPLLLLMGLKHGTIATLRSRLIQDPVYREIRPAQTREYPAEWFETLGKRREVAFLIPTILPASSIISVVKPGSSTTQLLDLIPTRAGDPLILENGGHVPEANQCVLTAAAAEDLGVSEGALLQVRATRSLSGRREFGQAMLRVVSVLSPRAGTLARMYAPLPFVLDVETYKEGQAVPERHWAGGVSRPYLSFDGLLVLLPQALDAVAMSGLIINTGLIGIDRLDAEGFRTITGFSLPPHLYAYHLTVQDAIHLSSYQAVKNKLRGQGAILLPYVKPMQFVISGKAETLSVFGISLSSAQAQALGLPEIPWGALDEAQAGTSYERESQILVPTSAGWPQGETRLVTVQGLEGPITFPITNRGVAPGDRALAPIELLATLRTGLQRKILFDEARKTFMLARIGFGGFRLYARTIDDVAPLTRELKRQGIEVITQVDAIERIRILDRGLTRIFWLVAVVGITGGVAALIASLYAAVERKKRDLSVMRLIGLSRFAVFRFPIYQGAAIAGLSLAVAIAGYFSLAEIINHVFSGDLEMGQKICALPAGYLAIAVIGTLAVAVLSSLFAAWRTTRIDPAEALREE